MGSGALQYKSGRITANWPLDITQAPGICAFEDFVQPIGATLADNSRVLINQAGTPTTAAAIVGTAGAPVAGFGGWLAGSVDNVDAEIDEIALGAKPWAVPDALGVQAIWCEVGFVIPVALTARQYFFGWTDDETEGTATNGSLNIQTGTTVVDVADDAAGFIFSSLATDVDGFYMANTAGGTQANVGNSGLTGIVDRYTKLRVVIGSNLTATYYGAVGSATANRYTVRPVAVGSKASAVTTAVPLVPLFAAAATATTAVEWEIDYIAAGVITS